MKQGLAIIVIIIAIVTVIFLVVLSNQATSKNQTAKRPAVSLTEGIVSSKSPTSITLSNGKTQRIVTVSQETEIVDLTGQPFLLDQIQNTFKVRIEEDQPDSPKRIIIISQPNVIVFSPESNMIVGQRFLVTGVARVFENTVSIKVIHSTTKETLLTTFTTADSPDIGKYGSFTKEIDLRSISQIKNGDKIILQVYQESAKDGSEIDIVRVPLTIDTKKNLLIKTFFTNEMLNPTTQCEMVFPVYREIPYTQAIARAALVELLKGPTDQEAVKGYGTAINSNVAISELAIIDGVATVDFSADMQKGVAGSCRVQSIRSQIIETLMQFPTVQSVTILVEGDGETSLQP